MKKWIVLVTYDASRSFEVDADTEDEAKEKAISESGVVCLCHHCSHQIDVGDPIDAVEAIEISSEKST